MAPQPRAVHRADAASVVCFYIVILAVIPARLVFSGIPLAIRPCMLLGLGMGLLWFCAHHVHALGMAKGRRWVRTGLFVFATTQIATYGYATVQYLPSDELKAADRSIITIMSFVAVGLVVCDGIRTMDRLETVLRYVVGACAFVAVVGLLQFFVGFDLAKYAAVPGLRAVGSADFVLERAALRRPSGTAGHPIEFGVLCATAAPLAAHLAMRAREERRPSARWWFCLLVVAIGVVVSLSRSAMLGLLVAGIVLLPTWPSRRRWTALALAVVFFGVLRAAVPGLVGTVVSLFSGISNDPSIEGRTDDYVTTSSSIAKHFWWGRGFGTYLPSKYTAIDNQYLGTIVENGYVGLAALLLLFLSAIITLVAVRARSRDPAIRTLAQTLLACVSVVAAATATFDLFAFSIITGLTFVLLGAAGALRRVTAPSVADQFPPVVGVGRG